MSEDNARPDVPERARLAELWPYVRDHTGVLSAIAVISLVATALALIQPLTLQRVIENPEERERLAAGARATRFPSWPEQAARFAAVLERVA